MKVKYISRMIVMLSFLFFNKINIFAEVNSYVKIKYENITLWDVCSDLVDKNRGEKIILGKIKVPGGKYLIRADKIKAELLNLGIKNSKIPETVTVERDFTEVKTADLEKILLDILKTGKTDFDYSVIISGRDTIKIPTGNIEYKIENTSSGNLGKKQIIAAVYENNQKVYEFPFSLNTGKLIKDYTLIKDVKKGEMYSQDKVDVKSELVYEETKLKNLDINENTVFTEDLPAGTKLKENHFEANAMVKKGEKVIVEVNYGDLKIADKGEALQNGEIGNEIDVKNLRTGKTIKATVVGDNRVEIKVNE